MIAAAAAADSKHSFCEPLKRTVYTWWVCARIGLRVKNVK
jgi:hypothetical protein